MFSCERGEENNNDTVWDRSILFGLQGSFLADRVDPAWDSLKQYVHTRLLGERVPYAVEAYPEHNMRHLSGESALFCRIISENRRNPYVGKAREPTGTVGFLFLSVFLILLQFSQLCGIIKAL